MKPFLLFQLRPNDDASDGEYQAILKHAGLKEDELQRVRMEQAPIPDINLDDYSGVIVGGGPSDVSNPIEKKNEAQLRFEEELKPIFKEIIEKDFPYLGECYGLGYLAQQLGSKVSKEKYSEDVGGTTIKLTDEAENDPLTKDLDKEFRAMCGHKEACQELPEGATLLATNEQCPIQIIRLKNNIYATQFHPELDVEGIILRIHIYKNAGYFPPEDAQKLIDRVKDEQISVPHKILRRFVERYKE